MKNKTESINIINSIIKFLNEGFNAEKSLEMTAKEQKLNNKKIEEVNQAILYDGINSLVTCINFFINQEMKTLISGDFKKLRVNEKIRFLILNRLKIIDKFFDKRLIFKLVVKQKSISKAGIMLFNVSDEIWHLSGDTSTDFNYYSKRIILMNVYFASFVYFLNDNSVEYAKTKDFIDKQISYVLKFGKLKSNLSNFIYFNKT
mgnify:FL=1|tara:strand:- start:13 stop:621 length:609 start_codon:yes stop_codon:yes gene_type:complete